MLLTEEEAMKMWCPRAHNGSDQECIASNCMAWRWFEKSKWDLDMNDGKGGEEVINHHQPDWKGFCGLAGRVE